MDLKKIEQERETLRRAVPMLKAIYGEFEIDPDQLDRPDAAIVLGDGRRIGVEITSLDPSSDRQYMNDEAYGADAKAAQRRRMERREPLLPQPLKKTVVTVTPDYLAKGALAKADKHSQYLAQGSYSDIVLLGSSDYLTLPCPELTTFYAPMASHLLGQASFPFAKVILVCEGGTMLVYDRSAPPTPKPDDSLDPHMFIEHSITMLGDSQSSNFMAEPLTPKKAPPKRKRKPRESKKRKSKKP